MARRMAWMALAGALALPGSAQAATYAVSETADTPVGQDCGGFADCSLREAVTSANASVGADTLLVQPGAYELTQGQLTVTDTLTIRRVGAGSVVIDANVGSRVIESVGAGTALTLQDLEVREGRVAADPARGGGILASGPLTLTGVTVRQNGVLAAGGAAEGGGIYHPGGAPIAITDSTIANNSASGLTSSTGAGLFTAGSTTLTNVDVSSNVAAGPGTGSGAGVRATGDLLVTTSQFFGNQLVPGGSARGAAIAASGTSFDLQSSELRGNYLNGPTALGGALWRSPSGAGDTTSIVGSRLRDNIVSATQGFGGAAYLAGTAPSIAGSTIDGNTLTAAGSNGGVAGGGLAVDAGTALSVVDSTITANTVHADGSGNSAVGGGVYVTTGGSSLTGVTVSGNTASGNALAAQVAGGGIGSVNAAQTIAAAGSIVSGNIQPDATADCANATLTSGGGNVVNHADGATGCSYAPGAGDIVTADPRLGPLGDHDGPTPTMLPASDSPAIDRYDLAGACHTATDQRGVARPQGPACDAGAVELRAATFSAAPATLAFGDVTAGDTSSAQTVTLTNGGEAPGVPALALAGPDAGDFTLTGCASAVAGGADCTASVAFAPTSAGAKNASLTGATPTVGLSGTGLPAPVPPPPPVSPVPACDDADVTTPFGVAAPVTLHCSVTVWGWEITAAPAHGTLSAIDDEGRLRYTPDPGFSGFDAFRYRALGPGGASAPAIVRVAVGPGGVAPAPIAPTTPPAAATCTVPDLVGRTVRGARRALRAAGCASAPLDVTRKGRPGPRARRIVRQQPPAGAPLHPGERIAVVARRPRR